MFGAFIGVVALGGTILGGIIGWLTYTELDEPLEARRERSVQGRSGPLFRARR